MVLCAGLAITIRDGAAMEQSALPILAAAKNKTHADFLPPYLLGPRFVVRLSGRGFLLVVRVFLGLFRWVTRRGVSFIRVCRALGLRTLGGSS